MCLIPNIELDSIPVHYTLFKVRERKSTTDNISMYLELLAIHLDLIQGNSKTHTYLKPRLKRKKKPGKYTNAAASFIDY